jgi:acetoin utilization deacetylase AcuC-like enzyme
MTTQAVKNSPAAKRGAVKLLSLNVAEGTVNGSRTNEFAELLGRAAVAAGQVLPALAQSWSSDAPSTLRGNVAAKIGSFDKVKRQSLSSLSKQSGSDSSSSSSDSDEEFQMPSLQEAFCLPMTSLQGAKRAASAMLVASVFAAELSDKERVPVLVLGRPPGHHATCAHRPALCAPQWKSPGGTLVGANLGGGCFYPSCWLAAVHCMRQGISNKLAYIDIDAHKPDGVWKEVDHLCQLGAARRAAVLNGKPDACKGVYFASLHVNGYPNPNQNWQSVACNIPKGNRRAFDVTVQEELLPPGVATGEVKNEVVLGAFKRWRTSVSAELRTIKPNGLFVGLGLDLHEYEKHVGDKEVGIGLRRQHYHKLIHGLPRSVLKGPMVLTLEGGYTKAGVIDGMLGVVSGLEALSAKARQSRSMTKLCFKKAKKSCQLKCRRMSKSSPSPRMCSSKRRSLSSSDRAKQARRLSA